MLINRENLLAKLQVVYKTVASTDRVHVQQLFCFTQGTIRSFDGVCGTLCKFDVGVNACVDADQFMQVVKSLPGNFEMHQDARGKIVIRYNDNKSEIELLAESTARFPDFIPKNFQPLLDKESGLAGAVSTLFDLNNTEARTPQFSGIGIKGKFLYALDGNRTTRAELKVPCANPYTIPIHAGLLFSSLGDPSLLVGNRNLLAAIYSEFLIATQLNASDAPTTAIDQQIELSDKQQVFCQFPVELLPALVRCKSFANEKTSGVKLSYAGGKLEVSSSVESKGGIREVIECHLPIDFKIHVQPTHLLDILKRTRVANLASLQLSNGRFLRFNGAGFNHIMCLMSPTT